MAKKVNYKLAEHEKYENRIDIFRSIQANNQNFTNINPNSYINPTFVSSNSNLGLGPRSIWTVEQNDPNVNEINSKTRAKFYNKNQTKFSSKKSKKLKIFLIIFLISLLIILIAIIAIILGVYLNRDKSSLKCTPQCANNRFCSKYQNQTKCECKPGYMENESSKQCDKSFCYNNYFPYTVLNTFSNTSTIPFDSNIKYLKPFCCPDENYLSNKCCGVSSSNKIFRPLARIIGGEQIEDGIFPWVVYLAHASRPNQNSALQFLKNCSGTLISDRLVLTAAHCIDPNPYNSGLNQEFPTIELLIRIYLGFVDKSNLKNAIERRVYKIHVHPEYDAEWLKNDLAIIELDKPVQRSDSVDFICLFDYDQTDNLVNSLKLYTAGWGSTVANSDSYIYPNKLHYVDLKIFEMNSCKYIYPNDPSLFNEQTHVCAGYLTGKDTCNQDSGGPLMVQLNGQWFLYGVVSFGSQPNCAMGPAIYVRISHYFNWIKIYL